MKTLHKLLLVCLLSSAFSFAMAQGQTLKGTIKDENGNPMERASIVEKQYPENGVVTDKNGEFTLHLRGKSRVISISSTNYLSKDVQAQDNGNVGVKMEPDVKGIEEVVVVGYGRQKKITQTGSVSSISGDDIRLTPGASLQNGLAGKITGFSSQLRSGQPGLDGASFFIRGLSTFNGSSGQPLILVDDIQYDYAQFARIDAMDVESVTVLKDAATTAIYGIKGANGVVLVTTRRGKAGKAKVSLSNQFAITTPIKPLQYLNSFQTATLRNQALDNDGLPHQFTQDDLDAFKNHTDPYGHPDVNWYQAVFKDQSLMNTSNLNVSGGTGRVRYFISGGFLWQDGLQRHFQTADDFNNNYYYKRTNLRSNLDIKATDNLQLKVDLSGNFNETNSPSVPSNALGDPFFLVSGYQYLPPYAYPVYNPDGTYGYNDRYITNREGNNIIGRMALVGYNRKFEDNLNLNISALEKLDKITKGLSIGGTLAYTSSNIATRSLTRGSNFPSYNYDPVANSYTPSSWNASTSRIQLLTLSTANSAAGYPLRRVNIQANINYSRTFGSHQVSVLALFNQTSDVTTNTDATLNNIPSKFRGYTSRVTYNFKQKYLIEFNGAYNGTDRFQLSKRYGFFPAVSAGWNIAEEGFIKNSLKFINVLKVRASQGTVGSDDVSSYRYIYSQTYTQASGAYNFGQTSNSFNGITEGSLPNNNVSWEKELKKNIGVDFGFFNGKLSGAVDVFNNLRSDILTAPQNVPLLFGQTLPPINIGRVSNKGYEIGVSYHNNIGKLNYNVKGTYSVAKNKILYMGEPTPRYPWKAITGQPINVSLAAMQSQGGYYQFNGFYQDQADIDSSAKPLGVIKPGMLKFKDLNGDQLIDANDQAYNSLPNLPQTTYGLALGFEYKGVAINALFQGAKDYNVGFIAESVEAFIANLQPVHQRAWVPGNGNYADYPALSTQTGGINSGRTYPSDYWNINANYIRLKSLEISWSLPQTILHQRFNMVRIFINGANLLTWSNIYKRYNYDPETVATYQASTGDGRGVYPQTKIFNFGLNVDFK